MDLSVVIVSWNVRERLRECLRSITKRVRDPGPSSEVFVVDNASSDESAEIVRGEFPNVHLIMNSENRGFAAACNQAIARSTGEFVLLLNPDMRVLPGTLGGIVAFMRERRNVRVGIAGGHLIDAQGATVPHVRRFPRLADQLAIVLKLPHLFPRILDRYLIRDFDHTKEARVDSIRGSFFCIRRQLIDAIGPLDEGFFIWFEEVDYCYRARMAGWQVAYTPSVQAIDYVGQSFRQVALHRKQRMTAASMCWYFRKHRPWWEWVVLTLAWQPILAGAWTHDALMRGHRVAGKA